MLWYVFIYNMIGVGRRFFFNFKQIVGGLEIIQEMLYFFGGLSNIVDWCLMCLKELKSKKWKFFDFLQNVMIWRMFF